MNTPRPKLLIDTDPGVDDALAIQLAHAHADVLGLCIAAGNVGLDRTVANALKLVEVLGACTPVFAGSPSALVRSEDDAAFVHGADGFGDTGYLPAVRRAEAEHAAVAILNLSRQYAGELTLVALAPLTNLVLALKLDPQLPQRVSRLVIMGGAVTGKGNTHRIGAEFNVGFDPEAAHVVFSSWPQFTLVDWELVVRHGVAHATMQDWLAAGDPRSGFYAAISRKTRTWMRARGRPRMLTADALAMAVALQPDIVSAAEHRHVAVELDGALTRGATVVDWERRSGLAPNAHIVLEVDQPRFEALLAEVLGAA